MITTQEEIKDCIRRISYQLADLDLYNIIVNVNISFPDLLNKTVIYMFVYSDELNECYKEVETIKEYIKANTDSILDLIAYR